MIPTYVRIPKDGVGLVAEPIRTAITIPKHVRRHVVSGLEMNQMPVWIPTPTATVLMLVEGMEMLVRRRVQNSAENLTMLHLLALMNGVVKHVATEVMDLESQTAKGVLLINAGKLVNFVSSLNSWFLNIGQMDTNCYIIKKYISFNQIHFYHLFSTMY